MSWRLLVLGIPTADVRRSSPQLSAELASTATFKTLTLHLGCIMSNMSNHAQYPWTGQDRGMVSNGEKSHERRQWVRFILPNMLTRLSWANGTETVTHLVSLVDVSANGAAVIMDVKPVTDRPCMIHFENGDISTRPIPANLVAMETTDSGRILAKFAFDSVLANRDLIPHQRDAEPGRGWSLARGEPVSPGELEMIPSRCPARCKTSAVEGSPSRPMSPHPGIRPSGSRWDQSVRKPAPPNAGWSGSETINQASSLLALHSSISARCNSTRPPSRFRSECAVPRRLR